MNKQIRIFLVLVMWLPVSVNAADIFVDTGYGGATYIRIEGTIEKGDLQKFKSVTKSFVLTSRSNLNDLPIRINSTGGNIDEAIEIGRVARELLASIVVNGNVFREFEGQWFYELEGKTMNKDGTPFIRLPVGEAIRKEHIRGCYSACVLILYGAVERTISDNIDQRDGGIGQDDKVIPTIGIHRPYYDKEYFKNLSPKEAQTAYVELEAKVRSYLTEMGAPQVLIDRMFFQASNEVEMVPAAEFRSLINDQEPYFEEWLISKCGAGTDGSEILSENEYRRVQEYRVLRSEEIERLMNNGDDYSGVAVDSYLPQGFTQEEVDSLYAKIREHNLQVWSCRSTAVREHLRETVLSPSY